MKLFGRDVEGHAKALTIVGAVFLVASGLCGAQLAVLNSSRSGVDNLAVIFGITGILELGVMLVSLFGIVLVSIAWLISAVSRRRATPENDPMAHEFLAQSEVREGDVQSPEEVKGNDEDSAA